jgi:cytochrome c oxidase subunit 4
MSSHVVPIRTYYAVFAALIVLTIVTVGLDMFVNLGTVHTAATLVIAVVKAALVILIFMHMLYSSRLTWIFAAAGLFWLAILIVYTLQDYLTRGDWRIGQ